ncbi:MAG: hypothetical protein ABIY55_01010 [Kofleriaceae bacterium]
MLEALALIAAVLVAVGGYSVVSQDRRAAERVKRALSQAKRYAISDLPEDVPGRVVGTVRPLRETLVAPLSQRSCVYYVVEVREKFGDHYRIVFRESNGAPFIVEDGTGRAIVDPSRALSALDFDDRSHSGGLLAPNMAAAAFLAKFEQSTTGWWLLYKTFEYCEAVIEAGNVVEILGSAVREPDPDAPRSGGYRDAPATRLRFSSSPKMPLLVSDHSKATTPA